MAMAYQHQPSFQDFGTTKDAPAFADCLKWSDDGALATASGNTVAIHYPGKFSGAAGVAGLPNKSNIMISAPGIPTGDDSLIHFDIAVSQSFAMNASNLKEKPLVRSLAWSPIGCTSTGRCALAACANDHQIFIYGRTTSHQSEWITLASPSHILLQYLESTSWACTSHGVYETVLIDETAADKNIVDGDLLRLRGGAKGKRPAKKSQPTPPNQEDHEATTTATTTTAAATTLNQHHSDDADDRHHKQDITTTLSPSLLSPPPPSASPTNTPAQELKKQASLRVIRRFFEYRRSVPPNLLLSYAQAGSHLKGADKETIQTLIQNEWNQSSELLQREAHLVSIKEFQKETLTLLRNVWDRYHNCLRPNCSALDLGLPGVPLNGDGDGGEDMPSRSVDDETESEDYGNDDNDNDNDGNAILKKRKPSKRQQKIAQRKQKIIKVTSIPIHTSIATTPLPADTETAAATTAASKEKKRKKPTEKKSELDPYNLPDTFTWRDLPPVDATSEYSMRQSLTRGAVRRFLRLRRDASQHQELPVYEGWKSPSKGYDRWLINRVTLEYTQAHAPALESMKFHRFQHAWISLLQKVWDKSIDKIIDPEFHLDGDDGLIHDDLDLIGEEESAAIALNPPVPLRSRQQQSKPTSQGHVVPPQALGGTALGGTALGGTALGGTAPRAPMSSPTTRQNKNKSTGDKSRPTTSKKLNWTNTKVDRAEFQRRLFLTSSLCIAWSPTLSSPTLPSFCLLAVGTKAGRVWLFRHILPEIPHAPVENEQEIDAWNERLSLIGWVDPGYNAWTTSIAWSALSSRNPSSTIDVPDCLILALGSSDGRVTLWRSVFAKKIVSLPSLTTTSTASTTSTTAQQPHASMTHCTIFSKLCTAVQPDLRPVTCLDMTIRRPSHHLSFPEIALAIGKTAGVVCIWISQPLKPNSTIMGTTTSTTTHNNDDNESYFPLNHGTLISPSALDCMATEIGCQNISGIALAAGGELVLVSGRQGCFASWSLPQMQSKTAPSSDIDTDTAARVESVLQPCLLPCACRKRKSKDSGFGTFGLAVSPGGLFVAVSKMALPEGCQYIKQLQVHQRVTLGHVHLYRIVGRDAAIQDAIAALRVLFHNWVMKIVPSSALWDAMHVISLSKEWMDKEELYRACNSIAETLEQTFFSVSHSVDLPGSIAEEAWRSLRAATTLRNIVASDAASCGCGLPAEHAMAIDRNEMYLLQRRLQDILQQQTVEHQPSIMADVVDNSNGNDAAPLLMPSSRLLAADAIVAHVANQHVMVGMLALASKAYHDAGETPPCEANNFTVAQRLAHPYFDSIQTSINGGSASSTLQASLKIQADKNNDDGGEGQVIVVPRCPFTLRVHAGDQGWICHACKRPYECPPQALYSSNTHRTENVDNILGGGAVVYKGDMECVLCAGTVGQMSLDFVVSPPFLE